MNALWSLLAFLVALGILVSFHELGHYSAAKFCGVKVLKFSIGFGGSIWKYQKDTNSTEWAISSIPLGGYVKMDDQSFRSKKLWQRSLIVAAGPIANFLLAILFLTVLFSSGVPQLPAKMVEPSKDTMAYEVGIYAGDQITGWRAEGEQSIRPIASWNQLRWRLMDSLTAKKTFSLEVLDTQNKPQLIVFNKEKLPNLSPNADPITQLGLKPDTSEPIQWFELRLNPIQSVYTASELSLIHI
jgi:regulator of sigma E protease